MRSISTPQGCAEEISSAVSEHLDRLQGFEGGRAFDGRDRFGPDPFARREGLLKCPPAWRSATRRARCRRCPLACFRFFRSRCSVRSSGTLGDRRRWPRDWLRRLPGAWYRASDVIAVLDGFAVEADDRSPLLNRWLTAMMVLFRPQIEQILIERDRAVERWRSMYPDSDVFEDRCLEITSSAEISLERQIEWLDSQIEQQRNGRSGNPILQGRLKLLLD